MPYFLSDWSATLRIHTSQQIGCADSRDLPFTERSLHPFAPLVCCSLCVPIATLDEHLLTGFLLPPISRIWVIHRSSRSLCGFTRLRRLCEPKFAVIFRLQVHGFSPCYPTNGRGESATRIQDRGRLVFGRDPTIRPRCAIYLRFYPPARGNSYRLSSWLRCLARATAEPKLGISLNSSIQQRIRMDFSTPLSARSRPQH